MCLVINPKEHVALKYKVAKEDIICYKILISYPDSVDLYTPFQITRVIGNQLVCDKFQTEPCRNLLDYTIDHGIHTFTHIHRAKISAFFLDLSNKCNPNVKYRNVNIKIFNCIVPNGTKYWINNIIGEMCSEKIILQYEIK